MQRDRRFRIEQREKVIRRRKRLIKDLGIMTNMKEGEMDKRHPLDCGNPNCLICHPHKFGKNYTKDDILEDIIEGEIDGELGDE